MLRLLPAVKIKEKRKAIPSRPPHPAAVTKAENNINPVAKPDAYL